MDLTAPRPKKHCRLPQNFPLPIILRKDGTLYKFKGCFNGFNVIIDKLEDMKNLISMGYFGKANLSRSYPQFNRDEAEIIRERQYQRRKEWGEKFSDKKFKNKVIVVPDSDEDDEEYCMNFQPKYEVDDSDIKETVWLSLDESFFLASALNCLDIHHEGKYLDLDEAWTAFLNSDPYFVHNYVVYYYFRMKNWVVKPGIKFGGDFLLYKQGPPFYHASYVVIIDILNDNLERIHKFSRRSMNNLNLLSLNRLCETAGKELLICQIIWPGDIRIDYKNISNVVLKENLLKRWISTQERNSEDS